MPTTADTPKCFAEVSGKRIIDWILDALRANGVEQICFIGGYQIDKVREAYPELAFCHNDDWQNNNILVSLFYAEQRMDEPFICCYSDILFNSHVVRSLMASDDDIDALDDGYDEVKRYLDVVPWQAKE